jgi:hypothetical protein
MPFGFARFGLPAATLCALPFVSGCGPSLRDIQLKYEAANPKPEWIAKPPADHYVGMSFCGSFDGARFGETSFRNSAYWSALGRKCGVHLEGIEDRSVTWILEPVRSYYFPCDKDQRKRMLYALFPTKDLDCGKLE